MAAQIKIKLIGMGDSSIHSGAWWDILLFPRSISYVFTKQPRVVSLLNHNECDLWVILFIKHFAGLLHSAHFMNEHLIKLPFAYPVSVEYDTLRLPSFSFFVEINKQLFHHDGQIIDNLLCTSRPLVFLYPNSRMIFRSIDIHTGHHSSD